MEYIKVVIKIFRSFLCISTLLSCNGTKNKEKLNFYQYAYKQDLSRIPLIEPLELISADNGFSWDFQFPYLQIPSTSNSGNVARVGIKAGIIVLYVERTYVLNNMNEAYFVINVNSKTEEVFVNQKDYEDYLTRKKISIKLYNVKEVFATFKETLVLPIDWVSEVAKSQE